MKYDPLELAWAAGFFDGEGCFGAHLRERSLYPLISAQIGQTDTRPLVRFQRAVGFGKIYGPYQYKLPSGRNAKPQYSWQECKFEYVQQLVCLLFYYLSEPKREQATRVLKKYHNLRAKAQEVTECVQQR